MKQQNNRKFDQIHKQHTNNLLQQRLIRLKALCASGWYALGNVLLLIGGDDSVDIRFNSKTIPLLNQPSLPLTINDNKG